MFKYQQFWHSSYVPGNKPVAYFFLAAASTPAATMNRPPAA